MLEQAKGVYIVAQTPFTEQGDIDCLVARLQRTLAEVARVVESRGIAQGLSPS
ncbi:MAG: hypothetical protein JHC61_08435 [Burkholderiaceae bacterium]|nr:hypothetical protein [Burkholderiaceae bacterium]